MPYQSYSQAQILCVLVGAVSKTSMTCSQSCHSLVVTVTYPKWSEPMMTLTSRYYNLTQPSSLSDPVLM